MDARALVGVDKVDACVVDLYCGIENQRFQSRPWSLSPDTHLDEEFIGLWLREGQGRLLNDVDAAGLQAFSLVSGNV